MAQQLIIREEFERAFRRVRLWETLVGVPSITAAATLLAVVLFFTDSLSFGPEIRAYARESGNFGAVVGGVGISVVLFGTLLPAMFLPAHWVNRKLGLRCPNCGRSITSIWIHRAPTPAGECRSCKYRLFDGASENATAN
jgi:hypothetical protein